MRSREVVNCVEFESGLAGELAGWVNVYNRDIGDGRSLTQAGVAYGQVSKNGARFETIRIEGSEYTQTVGISKCVEFEAYTPPNPNAEFYEHGHRTNKPEAIILNSLMRDSELGTFLEQDTKPPSVTGVWVVGGPQILEALKVGLSGVDADWLYPAMYYNLAYMSDFPTMLVDPGMVAQTESEWEHAFINSLSLAEIEDLDTEMLRKLSIFGGVSPEDIPQLFVNSREAARVKEADLQKRLGQMVLGRWYQPIGRGPGSRSWPFMDASRSDPDIAYGSELAALKSGNEKTAVKELEKELKEIEQRIKTASGISRTLSTLKSKEIALAGSA